MYEEKETSRLRTFYAFDISNPLNRESTAVRRVAIQRLTSLLPAIPSRTTDA